MITKKYPITSKHFTEKPFKRNFSKNNAEKEEVLNFLSTKALTNEQSNLCENKIHSIDLLDSMKSMKTTKLKVTTG